MAECEYIKEPKRDCVFCQMSKSSCRALNKMYCAEQIEPCRFYKSKYEYDIEGRPLKGK